MSFRKFIGIAIFWALWPGLYILLNNSRRTRVIVAVDDKVLFVHNWLGENKLSLPGGGVQKGESSKKAAVREVREETGLDLNIDELRLVAKDLTVREHGFKYQVDCYSVTVPKAVKTFSQHMEIMESVWVPWQQNIDTKYFSGNTNQLLHAWLSKRHLID